MHKITTTIQRQWLAEIVAGTKTIEYREVKPYWTMRLVQSGGTTIPCPFKMRLINGMSKKAPEVTVRIDKITVDTHVPPTQFELHIGKVLNVKNWPLRS